MYVLKDDAPKKEGVDENLVEPAAVAGYLMYSWTSLAASVTKLAGASIILLLLMFRRCVNRNNLVLHEESLGNESISSGICFGSYLWCQFFTLFYPCRCT